MKNFMTVRDMGAGPTRILCFYRLQPIIIGELYFSPRRPLLHVGGHALIVARALKPFQPARLAHVVSTDRGGFQHPAQVKCAYPPPADPFPGLQGGPLAAFPSRPARIGFILVCPSGGSCESIPLSRPHCACIVRGRDSGGCATLLTDAIRGDALAPNWPAPRR